ncbi:uncharacterized protein PV09_03836 [Verruconis gallopava]|uniref:Uncharacterized protein n=1 Tax=Verruconis gallopava TaxID=253628 RepID=A0A0D1XRJ3_9PEZI|nr:uncharacterized protein PV09_03836 [Verruconis gallopava]KIW05311.1 hypothetical protein PV09_03836 [Verruconis gallopava]
MSRQAKTLADVVKLQQTVELLSKAVQVVVAEWAKESEHLVAAVNGVSTSSAKTLPSRELYDAQRTILAATGMLTELVQEPSVRILEVATQFQESRALYIAAERRVADLLAVKDKTGGTPLSEISDHTRIESRKLSRILRYLTSIGIFKQTGPETFANNSVSAALVSNGPLRAYVQLVNSEAFSASDRLPRNLLHPVTGPSYDVTKTAWQDAIQTTKSRWDWIEERVEQEKLLDSGGHYPGIPSVVIEPPPKGEDGLVARPELAIMGLAMIGGGRVFGSAHVHDFPWASLGNSLIVDVGGGVGGFPLQLSMVYPDLRFEVQDRGPVIKQGLEHVWPKENPQALKDGRVKFTEHSFFEKNPTTGADIYILRLVLHDWSDEYCIKILKGIKDSMATKSRLLIIEQVMNTTLGSPDLQSAPAPLPANYGCYTRFSHSRDITMMASINGIERTPDEFRKLLDAAGLNFKKIWNVRSQMSLIEAILQ